MEPDANRCKHAQLLLIREDRQRLRCRHCHLTLTIDELADSYCPECWAERGKKRYDFEPMDAGGQPSVQYRCEACGVLLHPHNGQGVG